MPGLQQLERMTFRVITAVTLFSALVSGKEALGQAPTDKGKTDAPAAAPKDVAVQIVSIDRRTTPRGEEAEICVSANGGVSKVELAVDGVQVQRRPQTAARSETGEECPSNAWVFDVDLIPGTNQLEAVAYTASGAASQPDRDSVRGTSPVANTRLHILTVGIDTYGGSVPPLSYARKDARAFADSLRRQAQPLFASVIVDSLYDAAATPQSIKRKFLDLRDRVDSNDTFVFFYAGHGAVAMDDRFYLATVGVTDLRDEKIVAMEGIEDQELMGWLSYIRASSKLLVLDACNSGDLIRSFNGKDRTALRVLRELGRGQRIGILAATQPSEPARQSSARESGALGHGLFTAALLQNERGPGKRRAVHRFRDLDNAAREALQVLSKPYGATDQEPSTLAPDPDFPLIVR